MCAYESERAKMSGGHREAERRSYHMLVVYYFLFAVAERGVYNIHIVCAIFRVVYEYSRYFSKKMSIFLFNPYLF
jgi:hypothetical protein